MFHFVGAQVIVKEIQLFALLQRYIFVVELLNLKFLFSVLCLMNCNNACGSCRKYWQNMLFFGHKNLQKSHNKNAIAIY